MTSITTHYSEASVRRFAASMDLKLQKLRRSRMRSEPTYRVIDLHLNAVDFGGEAGASLPEVVEYLHGCAEVLRRIELRVLERSA